MITAALADLVNLVEHGPTESWSRPAGQLEWSIQETIDHLTDVCVWYAIQLASTAGRHTKIDARPPDTASPRNRLDTLTAAGVLLETVLAAVPPNRTAWHPFGPADVDRFALMALAEVAVHGHDITTGLDLRRRIDNASAQQLLDRLFPGTTLGADSPWDVLLWAHGRTALPGRARRTNWRWQ